jgi:hypothetical protein
MESFPSHQVMVEGRENRVPHTRVRLFCWTRTDEGYKHTTCV